jgi:hypothetical protein
MICLLLDVERQATYKLSIIRPFAKTEDQEASFNDDLLRLEAAQADLGDLPRDYNVRGSR